MRLGTDASIKTCREEGYTVIEFIKNDLLPGGVMNPDYQVHATRTVPSHMAKGFKNKYILDMYKSWNDVIAVFKEHEAAIRKSTGIPINFPPENPTPGDLLELIDAVICSYGLE